jgi:sugar phosphate isomerase/epimerase
MRKQTVADKSLSFGSTTWTLSWNPPYEDAIRRIAKTGCKSFELVAWDAATIKAYYTPQRISDLRSLADAEGLTLTNFFYRLRFEPQEGVATSKCDLDDFKLGIETAASLDSRVITTPTPYPFGRPLKPIMQRPTSQEWTAPADPRWDWTAEYNQVVDSFARACEIAARFGLRVAIEPHPYRWVSTGQGMLRLIERTGAPNLGFNFDPSHLFPSGDMPHFTILMLGERIFNTHFSDNDGQTNAHWRPGRGKIDWSGIFSALDVVRYSGPITLELEDAPGASHWTHTEAAGPELDQELKQSIIYLRERHALSTKRESDDQSN